MLSCRISAFWRGSLTKAYEDANIIAHVKAFEALQGPVLLGLALFMFRPLQDRIKIGGLGLHYALHSGKFRGCYLLTVGLVFQHGEEGCRHIFANSGSTWESLAMSNGSPFASNRSGGMGSSA